MIAMSTGLNNEALDSSAELTVFATPRTDGFVAESVDVFNYNAQVTMIHTCKTCGFIKTKITGGKISIFKKIRWVNCTNFAKFVYWEGSNKNNVIESPDGSFCNNLGLSSTYTACHVVNANNHNK